jgi:hypothetical protein
MGIFRGRLLLALEGREKSRDIIATLPCGPGY